MSLTEYVRFILDLIILPEASPPWWFKAGYSLTDTIVALCLLITIKMLFEIFLYEIAIYLSRLIYRLWGPRVIVKLRNRYRKVRFFRRQISGNLKNNKSPNKKSKSKIILLFQKWGYVGLFIAGFLPLPAFWGSLGPLLYNLERLDKPWFKIWNYHLLCLWLGYMTKAVISIMIFHASS